MNVLDCIKYQKQVQVEHSNNFGGFMTVLHNRDVMTT